MEKEKDMKIIKVIFTNVEGKTEQDKRYVLTIGNIYEAIDVNDEDYAPYRSQYEERVRPERYHLIDDTGVDRSFPKSYFTTLSELRNKQIDSILED